MIFVNYLSTKDREKLSELDNLIQNSTDMDERAKLFSKRGEVEQKRKQLHECNIKECMELSKQLYDQLQQHVALGNRTQVIQFQNMIAGVNQRTAALYADLNNEAIEKQAAAEKKIRKNVDNDDESSDDKISKRKSKKRATSNSWTISVDQFD